MLFEEQAFARVHRLGQEKKIYRVKFVVKDSVDDKILEIQNAKAEQIGNAHSGERKGGVSRRAIIKAIIKEKDMDIDGETDDEEEYNDAPVRNAVPLDGNQD